MNILQTFANPEDIKGKEEEFKVGSDEDVERVRRCHQVSKVVII